MTDSNKDNILFVTMTYGNKEIILTQRKWHNVQKLGYGQKKKSLEMKNYFRVP